MERAWFRSSEGDNGSTGLFWPQRNYTCSFCKRQFNSAQALGGHMNVHRRDRAMLIQLPSWVFECPNPNNIKSHPNPSFSSSPSLSSSYPLPTSFSSTPSHNQLEKKLSTPESHTSSPLTSEDFSNKNKNAGDFTEVEEFKNLHGFPQKYELDILNKSEVISLELEIGCKDPKEVLDLELRLGCF